MQPCYALLLDAGFLRYQLGTHSQPADAAAIVDFVDRVAKLPQLANMRLHRVYVYDARPLSGIDHNPIDGTPVDFGASDTFARGLAMHNALLQAPYFALRFGELHQEGWRLKKKVLLKAANARAQAAGKAAPASVAGSTPSPTSAKPAAIPTAAPAVATTGAAAPNSPVGGIASPSTLSIKAGDLQPNIRQKGVDMRIGLDIANLTLKKQAQVIVLATADSDFVPAMKFARREGAQLILITLGHGVKPSMVEHADVVISKV